MYPSNMKGIITFRTMNLGRSRLFTVFRINFYFQSFIAFVFWLFDINRFAAELLAVTASQSYHCASSLPPCISIGHHRPRYRHPPGIGPMFNPFTFLTTMQSVHLSMMVAICVPTSPKLVHSTWNAVCNRIGIIFICYSSKSNSRGQSHIAHNPYSILFILKLLKLRTRIARQRFVFYIYFFSPSKWHTKIPTFVIYVSHWWLTPHDRFTISAERILCVFCTTLE